MKIAFVVSNFPKLSETFVLNQITGLLDRGQEVDIFPFFGPLEPMAHPDVGNYRLLERTYYQVPAPSAKMVRIRKAASLVGRNLLNQAQPILNSLNFIQHGQEARSLYLLFRVAPFLGKGPHDIIQCHFGHIGNKALYLRDLGALRGKIVTMFHGYDITAYVQKNGAHVYMDLFRKGDLFLCISEDMREKLVKLGCDRNKTVIHRVGVDTRKIIHGIPNPDRQGRIRILTIGRLVEKKGIAYGLAAVAKLVNKHPHLVYQIVGEGPLKSVLEKETADLGIHKNVIFLGWKQQEEIIQLLSETDILMAPSVTAADGDQEGIPVSLMEGMARGLPVIGSMHSGIPELIQDGVNGFLVPERDVDALATKLQLLITNAELRVSLGKAGRLHVEQHFDIHHLNDKLLMIYQKLVMSSD